MANSREFPETLPPSPPAARFNIGTLDHIPDAAATPATDTPTSVPSGRDPATDGTPATNDYPATFAPGPKGGPHPPTDPDTPGSSAVIGGRIGRSLPTIPGFDILGEIGRGGMGVVYKARQLDLNRLVAIKMVLADKFDRPEDLVRFRLEAEMVARVRHPNVVQVYESGAWEGHPYLVLEWVEGGTLSAYLTEKPQPPEFGARTVELLARAIHAAHCNGVVHRDLKPGNILVARGGDSASGAPRPATHPASTVNRLDTLSTTLTIDGRPVPMTPKIADFGIAKQLIGATHLTETGKILGTPEYMAPEQADSRSDLTGPATDVYALGVILYQMLTGRTPFRGGSGVALLMRVIEEAPRPPRALQPKLPRDLETICLKCLAKHPLSRYQTAESLADDLCAFLDGRPITARPTGAVERAWKWAQRRPAVAGLSVAAALFFILGFVGVTWQWQAAAAQRDRAEDAERATLKAEGSMRTEKAATDLVNRFLGDLLSAAAPEKQLGRTMTVAEALQNASARIDGAFPDRPELEATDRLTLGNAYRKLGLFEPADRHLTAALDLRRKTLGEMHRDTLAAAADRGLLLADERKWDEAVPLLRRVVADSGANFGPDDSVTIESTGRLALALQQSGNVAEAEALFKDALAAARRVFGSTDPRTLSIVNDFGMLAQARKQLLQAEAAFREAADGRAKALAPAHPATLESLNNLAVVLDEEGQWAKAKPIFQQVLADKRRILGRDHLDTLSTMNNLADLLARHGEPDAALPLFDDAYEGFRATLGRDNPETLKVQNALGGFYFRFGLLSGRPELRERAATILAAVLETRRRVLSPDHPDTLQSAHDLGAVLTHLNKLDDAEAILKEALAGRRKVLGPGSPDTLETEVNYIQLLGRQKRVAAAIAECRDALTAATKAGNTECRQSILLLLRLVELLAKERPADALEPAERAVALASKVHGLLADETINARVSLGAVLMSLGRPVDAELHLRAAYDAFRAVSPTDKRTALMVGKLGTCLFLQKRYQDAEPLLIECFETTCGLQNVPPPVIRSAVDQLVKLYVAWGKPEKAAEWREKLK